MFTKIDSQEAMSRFIERVDGFHDGILREMAFLSRGYVDRRLRMFGDVEPCDVRVIVQMQAVETPSVEIVMGEVAEVALRPGLPLVLSGSYAEEGVSLRLGEALDGCFVGVKAKSARYRILDEAFLGELPVAVDAIAVGGGRDGVDVGGGWLQCPVCADAVCAKSLVRTIRCESCREFLELPLELQRMQRAKEVNAGETS